MFSTALQPVKLRYFPSATASQVALLPKGHSHVQFDLLILITKTASNLFLWVEALLGASCAMDAGIDSDTDKSAFNHDF